MPTGARSISERAALVRPRQDAVSNDRDRCSGRQPDFREAVARFLGDTDDPVEMPEHAAVPGSLPRAPHLVRQMLGPHDDGNCGSAGDRGGKGPLPCDARVDVENAEILPAEPGEETVSRTVRQFPREDLDTQRRSAIEERLSRPRGRADE
jgi:hypothetical protein